MKMWMILIGILFLMVHLLTREYLAQTREFRELGNKIPGPKPLPVIGNGLEFGFSTNFMLQYVNWLMKEYGPVARIWLGPMLGIFVADPLSVELLLGNNKHINKSSIYRFAEPCLGQGLVVSKGDIWKKHRKIIAPTFHGQILAKFVEVFNSNLDVLIENLSKHQGGPAFDIFPYMNNFSLDVICESAMGVKVDAQSHSDSDFVKAVHCLEKAFYARTFTPWLHPDVLYGLSSVSRQFKKSSRVILGMTKKVLHERKQTRSTGSVGKHSNNEEESAGTVKKKAFLDYLLDYTEKGGQLTNQDLQDEVNNILLAGHESTGYVLSYTCWLLAKHPDIQEKTFAELKTIYGDSLRDCTPQDLTEMKYLEQVIKESLRLLPPLPLFARKLSEDIKSDKYIFPAGSEVAINVYMLHRHPDYFPDPEKFDPDRFLPENCAGRHPYCYIPFSAGPRNCIGYKFATQQMKTSMARLLRHFKILPAENPFQDLQLVTEVILKSKNGVRIRLEPRSKQIHLPHPCEDNSN